MRFWTLLLLPLLLAIAARAEEPIVASPLPPLDTQPKLPVPLSSGWLPRGTAQLQALDKVNARATVLAVKVGQSVSYGTLTIGVRGCVVRPGDQPADAAAFLVVTDRTPGAPGFSGWMLRSDPSLSMLAHPIYDLRVIGCAA